MTWQDVAREFGVLSDWFDAYRSSKYKDAPLEKMAEEIARLREIIEYAEKACSQHSKCVWAMCVESQKANYETAVHRMEAAESKLAHSERRREKLREALQKISGTDEIFEKTEFDLCDCEESNAYLQMNKRRKRTAREALDADAAEDNV